MASPTDFRMYYHSWDAGRQRFVVGFATSSDALRWRKQGPIFEGGQSQSEHDAGVSDHIEAHVQDMRQDLIRTVALKARHTAAVVNWPPPAIIRKEQTCD